MQYAIAVFGILTAIAIVFAALATSQISRLQTQETRQLRTQIGEANRKAEEERLARIKLEKHIAPRSLTAEQQAVLLAALRRGPKGAVTIVSVLGDRESLAFANELSAILQQAGWPTNTGGQITLNPPGLLIAVGDPTNPPPHALAFQHALAAIGLEALWTREGGLSPQSFRLIVGHKPQQ